MTELAQLDEGVEYDVTLRSRDQTDRTYRGIYTGADVDPVVERDDDGLTLRFELTSMVYWEDGRATGVALPPGAMKAGVVMHVWPEDYISAKRTTRMH